MRMLHTMLRVGDLQRSIDFYTNVLGMKLLRTSDNPEYKYKLAFMGYGTNPEHAELELTYNYGVDRTRWAPPMAISRSASTTPGKPATRRNAGGNVTREPGPVKGGYHRDRLPERPGWLQGGTDREAGGVVGLHRN